MRAAILIGILVVLAVGGYLLLANPTKTALEVPTEIDDTTMQYTNSSYGVSFQYPRAYALREIEAGNAERAHYSITLIDKEALADMPQNGEGPPVITVDIFQNDLDQLSIDAWLRNSNNSNFKLSPDDVITSTTLAGKPALSYTWDGLYRGESIIAEHKNNIVMVSKQFLTQEDAIVGDFQRVISSLKFF